MVLSNVHVNIGVLLGKKALRACLAREAGNPVVEYRHVVCCVVLGEKGDIAGLAPKTEDLVFRSVLVFSGFFLTDELLRATLAFESRKPVGNIIHMLMRRRFPSKPRLAGFALVRCPVAVLRLMVLRGLLREKHHMAGIAIEWNPPVPKKIHMLFHRR